MLDFRRWFPWPWPKKDPYVNPDLDPVLLVPGIGGSILSAVNEKGHKERVWVRLFAADHEFKSKLWSLFDPETGKTVSLDPKTNIEVPKDRHGLYCCDNLDPDMLVPMSITFYFHDLIQNLLDWGYEEGSTLFGFGYDFRQSNRLPEVMENFKAQLELAYVSSGGKKVNIISHSMGGVLVKSFLALYHNDFEKYVNTWIAIAVPFQGAPGFILDVLLTGCEFVKGWERELFVAKWSIHQLLIECPSVYELMANPDFNWPRAPLLKIWQEMVDISGNTCVKLHSYGPNELFSVLTEALINNTITYGGKTIPLPFNDSILGWANQTRKIWQTAKLPPGVKFYNIFGTSNDTPLDVCYGSETLPIKNLQDILHTQADFFCVDGDGTVPQISAMADNLDAIARVGIPGDHRGLLCKGRLFRVLKEWLNIGEPDPFYDPFIDYVIIPSNEEWETYVREALSISDDECTNKSRRFLKDSLPYCEGSTVEFVARLEGIDSGCNHVCAEACTAVCVCSMPFGVEKSHFRMSTLSFAEGTDLIQKATAFNQVISAASIKAVAANMKISTSML